MEKKEEKQIIKLDYSLNSPIERTELVRKICENADPETLTPRYLEILSDYIIFEVDREERKKQKDILSKNRLITINTHETSYQGLVSKLENGEDGMFNMTAEYESKNVILKPKILITPKDIEKYPELKEKKVAIDNVKKQFEKATGRRRYELKKQLIELAKEQYTIKGELNPPIYCQNIVKSFRNIDFSETLYIDENGDIQSTGILSFLNWEHISLLLCNYSKLKEAAWGEFWCDSYYLMEDLDNLIEKTLKEKYPLYYDLIIYKIDGKQNSEIQILLEQTYNIKNSIEYISNLWRQKIPKLLAKQAQKDALIWYRKKNGGGYWKKCTRCGEKKLAHKLFYSSNRSSKDGWYSICKDCRNKK